MAGIRQFDEDKTLDVALGVFWQKGLGATSMQDLAQATGVQRGSLYNAYQSKECLFLRVFDGYKAKMLGDMGASLNHPSIDVALRNFLAFSISSMTQGSPTRGCLSTKTAVDEHNADLDTVRSALQGFLNEMEGLLTARFEAEEARSKLAIAPVDAARVIVTFTRGIVVLERIYQDVERLRKNADLIVQLLLPSRAN
ncbi:MULTISPECIES: TetR/AcrR family transcriptional regulator [unclassified Pseudomonas]|uniref:TetR/AcrR family transcriptional regulator n=1 Tax=unclassified Pseudomonas TaxID=196821 RepID=UPI002AC939F0|nr:MULTISPECIES: TetR/AcrR family transcriptional regulator [unclassified Pseudomonas]MEB0043544.1 TetR/AcrR family transcriptional regulator [Pseudomonas sp. MH10]MEB0079964.1 TetR/AcrR family transcriptional regulator [Pseudomonas sp. MH10out]MEB0093981.1 TetR/AcrR family transcriptional regulator [Pseudomonas sp. CCI4.2]MEB0102442.1 TetR/AcrR family transcriptional regulator [Pseudomonas sp. CCI3.2]MEB0123327.1 TetR/AcrR family transcriptional regulator [Pseudomonas sp. CCI1.2]